MSNEPKFKFGDKVVLYKDMKRHNAEVMQGPFYPGVVVLVGGAFFTRFSYIVHTESGESFLRIEEELTLVEPEEQWEPCEGEHRGAHGMKVVYKGALEKRVTA